MDEADEDDEDDGDIWCGHSCIWNGNGTFSTGFFLLF